MQKNTAGQKYTVFAFNRTTNAPETGDALNITANISLDYGAAAATNDINPTETEDGFYTFDAIQAETNANTIQVFPASTTTDIQVISVPGVIFTTPVAFADNIIQSGDTFTRLGAPTGISHAADIADIPTVTEFNARTLVAADYFNSATDTVANVTTVGAVTGAVGSVTAAILLPSIPANWITAGGIAVGAFNGKGDWNIGKTGYTLTQTFPSNFTDMAITTTTGLVSVGTNNDKTGYTLTVTPPTAIEVRQEMDLNSVDLNSILTNIAALNNLSLTEVLNTPLTKASYNVGQSLAKILRELGAWNSAEGAVTGIPTTTVVPTNITGHDANFFVDQGFWAYNGSSQTGQSRVVVAYATDGTFTFDEPFTTALVAGDDVIIAAPHIHNMTEIREQVRVEMDSNSIQLAKLGSPVVDISADIAAIKTDMTTILLDTNELQLAWVDGGRLDVILDAINTAVVTPVTLSGTERNAIADALLDRNMATGADTSTDAIRTVRAALRQNRNRVVISGGVMTVYKEDDITPSWTAAIVTAPGDPIISMDPT